MTAATELYLEIELLRKKLYKLIEENSLDVNLEEIINVSRELDQLILIYQKEEYLKERKE
ncbi:aspartyl-phosphate phosphatase Spo0E family protein [Geosporobacter ferrireducens]|uniref:Uncharacterized protein n=1 Tax=Geosporobacter ferrireducens TaxID=1424294 RepID=A0A1D8GGP2_9FIRM|nr:aspartyl-phosphate phosphatase Spo0E family protein [Geosporobacter ferrireducens]AOT70046.1 hypothetical protein Gferi_10880 [Geosporobacter ferrireducens]MTI53407.1 aspartyl-phosphate phosphatase Spo0E family protein [Geosporobacter ferrireducens]